MLKGTTEGWEPFWTEDSNFIVRKIGDQLISFRRAEPTTGMFVKFYLIFKMSGKSDCVSKRHTLYLILMHVIFYFGNFQLLLNNELKIC